MEIYQMTPDRIKETADSAGGGFDSLLRIYNQADMRGCVVWVRVGPRFIQRVFVDKELVNDVIVKNALADEHMWIQAQIGAEVVDISEA